MIVTKRNSRNDLLNLNNLIDSFINHNFAKTDGNSASKPNVNIIENENDFELHIALPGVPKDSINIGVDGDLLTISNTAEKKSETKSEEGETDKKEVKFLRKEFNYNNFKRTFTLPESVNATEINASNENGVLTITLPKKEEAKAIKKTISIS